QALAIDNEASAGGQLAHTQDQAFGRRYIAECQHMAELRRIESGAEGGIRKKSLRLAGKM
ncbi:hypothetical protein, partial [Rhizobium ecuadorense]|uniref:hypothetical protein n=1 Tax=Rhizobium ecuadorense TaxID=1671795 RepID=UPI001AEC64C6